MAGGEGELKRGLGLPAIAIELARRLRTGERGVGTIEAAASALESLADLLERTQGVLEKALTHKALASERLTGALLAVEWAGVRGTCPRCAGCRADESAPDFAAHGHDCGLDAALTAAGLDTQVKRDAERTEMGR